MSIKLPRTCHAGLSGPDVLAYSRVYHLHTKPQIRQHDPTHDFGVRMVANTMEFQKRHHLRADGVVGPKTFEAMRSHFDGYDRYLLGQEIKHLRVGPRDLIVGAALALYAMRPFTYQQVRPMPWPLHEFDVYGSDCSGTSTQCYKYAHLSYPNVADPNELGFSNYGSTYTMVPHGRSVSQPKPGDLAFYYPSYDHVGVFLGNNRVFSHGAPGDPKIIPASWATMFRSYLND